MTTLTASDAKAKFLKLLRDAHDLSARYTVTHNGKPYAVIMGKDEHEGMLETIEILKNKNLSQELLKSIERSDKGETVSFEDVVGRKQQK